MRVCMSLRRCTIASHHRAAAPSPCVVVALHCCYVIARRRLVASLSHRLVVLPRRRTALLRRIVAPWLHSRRIPPLRRCVVASSRRCCAVALPHSVSHQCSIASLRPHCVALRCGGVCGVVVVSFGSGSRQAPANLTPTSKSKSITRALASTRKPEPTLVTNSFSPSLDPRKQQQVQS